MKTLSIGKCSVWVYGSVMGNAGWEENKVLEVGEGFQNQREARAWAKGAMERLRVPGITNPSKYKIGPAY